MARFYQPDLSQNVDCASVYSEYLRWKSDKHFGELGCDPQSYRNWQVIPLCTNSSSFLQR